MPILLALYGACTSTEPAPEAATPPPVETADATIERARTAMQDLGKTLKGKLVGAMTEEGPVAAATVCATEAQSLTAAIGTKHGVTVGRSSTRLRNPADAGPDWVQQWLATQSEGADVTGLSTVADTPDGRVARVLKPIHIEAPCLVCHGPADQMLPEVAEVLAKHYPEDRATGYALGDLRGAIWAEGPVR